MKGLIAAMQEKLERIREIKQKHETRWLRLEGVVAVGIGQIEGIGPGIIISVEKETEYLRRLLPTEIEGIPVRLNKTGTIRSH